MRSSPRVGVQLAVFLITVIAAPGIARAGAWYYTWQCSGGCAPGQLAISGVEGPFASYEQCDGARAGDSRRDYFLAEGNLGGLNLCEESDAPPAPSGGGAAAAGRAAVPARVMLAGVIGGGYRVEDATGIQPSTGSTEGVELSIQFGGHPEFGLELGVGYHASNVTAAHFGADPHPIKFVPILLGFTSTPALVHTDNVELRLDLGADVGDFFRVDCTECSADNLPGDAFVGLLRAGLDIYVGRERSYGLGVSGVALFGSQGNVHDDVSPSLVEIRVPTYLVRVQLLARHHDGVAW